VRRKVEQGGREDLTIGGDDHDIRVQSLSLLDEVRMAALLRLPDGESEAERRLLDGRRLALQVASARSVGLGHHPEKSERRGCGEGFEAGTGEFCCAEEQDA
jgi:hypothetical protein